MNIAIWGLGVSGISALRYLSRNTSHQLYAINQGSVDSWAQKREVTQFISENNCFDQADISKDLHLDLIILSPGIDPEIPELRPFNQVEKICEVELAFRESKRNLPIIAVTGTNGKTTTVTLISEALKLAGKRVFLGGNIGTPFCDFVEDEVQYDVVVLELSSFQLELLDSFRANIACILNITPSHMERYQGFNDYESAKLNIVSNQNENDWYIAPAKYLDQASAARKIELAKLSGHKWEHSVLKGEHHKFNFYIVEKVLEYFHFSPKDIVQNLIDSFRGVSYRLQYLGEIEAAKFYNDAKSTNTEATLTALKSFSDTGVVLILGGKRRDGIQDLSAIKDFKSIKKIYAIGDAQEEINSQLGQDFEVYLAGDLESAFINSVKDGVTVLFSPAYPSFDQYKNYIARGEHFDNLFLKYSTN